MNSKKLPIVKDALPDQNVVMVEKFMCPGCVCGSNTKDGCYKPENNYGHSCGGHVLGTMILGIGHIALGMPKGFNRMERDVRVERTPIRLWTKGTKPDWDKFNIATWAMVEDDYLFVRTYCPRTAFQYVDVIEGGTLKMVPGAVDVGEFVDDID